MNLSAEKLAMPSVCDEKDFDKNSGNLLERIVFNNRFLVLLICAIVTALLAWKASGVVVNAGFDKMIPQHHPYVQNYFDNREKLGGLGNVVRVVVENPSGDIFDPQFLEATKKINEALYLAPGVDRSFMKSIWMAAVRWTEVTEEGFRGGPVMPENYDGTPRSIETLKAQIRSAGIVGSLVASDFRSIMIIVPLLESKAGSEDRLDYREFSRYLDAEVRQKYELSRAIGAIAQSHEGPGVKIHIIGFAKLVGDLIDGLWRVMAYFLVAALLAAGIILCYTRCLRSTVLVITCSLMAVVWELGLVEMLGFEIDPYSILVPFLVFAIGVSHGAQKMNGIMQDVGRGTHKYVAARYTFRRLFLAGVTALLADVVGFAVLIAIDIPVIKDLALTASIGVATLIVTNLLMLPVLLSLTGVSPAAARRSLAEESGNRSTGGFARVCLILERFTERRWAAGAVLVALMLAGGGYALSLRLQIGDLDPGAPELRKDSPYNLDVAYINSHYALSSDEFVVMVTTRSEGCSEYKTLKQTENLTWALQHVPGVQDATAMSDKVRNVAAGLQEGNPKWLTISRNAQLLGGATQLTLQDNPDAVDKACSTIPVIAYLQDHKADTLKRVAAAAEQFAKNNNDADVKFLLAAGSAGIEAATNSVVEKASRTMLLYVYAAVTLLCFVTFRSWRAVVVAIIPLALTSILCEALMVVLGLGVKVATLPVIALGVGIGVDYALYLLSVQLDLQRAGKSLHQAYREALQFTGKVVALVGVTLAAGVLTWAWSPIKFQADMGILLAFMFLWNMLAALILIPALSYFLLGSVKTRTLPALIDAGPGKAPAH